jgi:hypothetical protein
MRILKANVVEKSEGNIRGKSVWSSRQYADGHRSQPSCQPKKRQDFKETILTNLEILVGSFAGIYLSLYFFP